MTAGRNVASRKSLQLETRYNTNFTAVWDAINGSTRSSVALVGQYSTTGTGFTTVSDGTNTFSLAVTSGTYAFRAYMCYSGNSGGTGKFQVNCGIATAALMSLTCSTATASTFIKVATPSAGMSTPALTSTAAGAVIEGTVTVSGTGTISIAGGENNSGDSMTVDQGSYFEVFPVTSSIIA